VSPTHALAAKSLLFPYPRMTVRRLFLIFNRVKLDSLEAQLRPVEQLDRRPTRMAEGKITQDAVIEIPVSAAHALAAKHAVSRSPLTTFNKRLQCYLANQ
jgi:hypothetical protein